MERSPELGWAILGSRTHRRQLPSTAGRKGALNRYDPDGRVRESKIAPPKTAPGQLFAGALAAIHRHYEQQRQQQQEKRLRDLQDCGID